MASITGRDCFWRSSYFSSEMCIRDSCYTCRFQHILYHGHCKFSCCHIIGMQIIRYIHKHFVNRIRKNIFRCNIFQINAVNSGAVFQIESHPGRSNNIINLQCRIDILFCTVIRRTNKCSVPVSYTHLDVYKRQLMIRAIKTRSVFPVFASACP